ncbi:sensor histidine kinase [Pandoraea sputorum]|uniref:sensor histidine kinase n=1 Tax=Pandoraea sputorum TaxID=93222 RepID=UPI0012428C34|nr:HAMP domain-containing sensor histidine kinase [Pandoraea sputorum]VVE77066.1 Sensor kinase CusS [Pandoraea sputorum]
MSSTPTTERSFLRSLWGAGPIFTIFIVSVVSLFVVIYWLTMSYLTDLVDSRLQRESAQLVRRSAADARVNITERSRREVANVRPYGLFNQNGQRLAGNVEALPKGVPDWRAYRYTQTITDKEGGVWDRPYRAMIATMPDGNRVVVGQAVDDIDRFDHMLLRVAAGGLLATILLGAICGYALHRASNQRVRQLRESCQDIVSSHFTRRLPTRGRRDDIDLLVGFVNTMLDDIERLVAELRGVCAWIAHDLRTPMTSLRAGLERARRGAMCAAEYDTAVERALEQTDHVLDRFSALLRIAEIDAHARREHFRPVDLARIAEDVVDLYEPLAEERVVTLSVETHRSAPILGDGDLIFGAIQNLLDNALKFTPAGGAVHLRVMSTPQHAIVEVRDTGPGIASTERDAVLRPFYRGACMSGMPTPGHGLGLSVVAATARIHNATMRIDDAFPGCRVALRFAAATNVQDAADTVTETPYNPMMPNVAST